ncbi:hypothetical protein [uncultured Pseudacidovorax sp.]|uniref:hypothetical protein n=1 Tax=uncultured Pseudacidovorax sp. TaxID=679313 RepID=UPI0025E537AC|nr:hypothetical protein [uncultured Pseudacidovorax sp.]
MPRGGARPGAGRPRKSPEASAKGTSKASRKPSAKASGKPATEQGKPQSFVDADGFKTADAPAGWPFGKQHAEPPPAEDLSELTPLDFLLSVMRDSEKDLAKRMQAASLAAPYVHPRKGESGKKEEKLKAAEKVAGRFAPSAPPKLVAAGGKKVT